MSKPAIASVLACFGSMQCRETQNFLACSCFRKVIAGLPRSCQNRTDSSELFERRTLECFRFSPLFVSTPPIFCTALSSVAGCGTSHLCLVLEAVHENSCTLLLFVRRNVCGRGTKHRCRRFIGLSVRHNLQFCLDRRRASAPCPVCAISTRKLSVGLLCAVGGDYYAAVFICLSETLGVSSSLSMVSIVASHVLCHLSNMLHVNLWHHNIQTLGIDLMIGHVLRRVVRRTVCTNALVSASRFPRENMSARVTSLVCAGRYLCLCRRQCAATLMNSLLLTYRTNIYRQRSCFRRRCAQIVPVFDFGIPIGRQPDSEQEAMSQRVQCQQLKSPDILAYCSVKLLRRRSIAGAFGKA